MFLLRRVGLEHLLGSAVACRASPLVLSSAKTAPNRSIRWYSSHGANSTPEVKVCIVGSGPAGFYTAKYLLQQQSKSASSSSSRTVDVTLIDKYPTPYGLVRYGVAPDHPEVKLVTNDFAGVMEKHRDHVRFLGNVELGKDVNYEELKQLFDVVVLSYGASHERMLGIPGERELSREGRGVASAREFVAWYNGLPEQHALHADSSLETTQQQQRQHLEQSGAATEHGDAHPGHWSVDEMTRRCAMLLRRAERVVIIGQGNVALDVARILAKTPSELHPYDMTEYALKALEEHGAGVRDIVVAGRRGPVQAACTTKELRELTKLQAANLVIDPSELQLDDISKSELETGERAKRRMFELMQTAAAAHPVADDESAQGKKSVRLVFFRNPVEFIAGSDGNLRAVRFERTKLVQSGDNGSVRAVGTGQYEDVECQLAFKSIGYRSVSVPGVPFDHHAGIVPNV